MLKSLETGERAAIETVGQFLITVEEALPQEVAGTSEVAKKSTVSGLEMADGLIHTECDFMRNVIASAAKSLSSPAAQSRKPSSRSSTTQQPARRSASPSQSGTCFGACVATL